MLNSDLKNVVQRNDVSEQEVETMLKDMGEELKREKPQKLKRLGIDEIAVVKGQGNYYGVLVDLDKGSLIELIEKRTEEEVTKYLETWGEETLRQVEEVSIDFWKPYKKVVEKLMPQAEIVADRFHVMKQVNDELNCKRRTVKRETEKLKNGEKKEKILAGLKPSKYALLKNKKDSRKVRKRTLKSCVGKLTITTKQAEKLGIESYTRHSPL